MAVIATLSIGSNSYSVYALTSDVMADTKAYFAAHVNGAAWTAAAPDNGQKKALVSAFRSLERKRWSGSKLVPSQATQWPRTGATCFGEVEPDGIPDEIALGEFELALALVLDPTVLSKSSSRSDVRSAKAGSAAVEFFQAPPGEETVYPTVVQELVGCFLSGAASGVGAGLASGTDEQSQFTPDDFERTEGYA